MLVADWSLTVWRSVSPRKGWGSSQYSGNFICDWSAMKQWSISALSPTKLAISCKVVSKRAPVIWRWVYRCHRPVCVCQSFHNKCSKSSDRLLKIVCKSSSKRDLLAIQGLNQYCLRLLINRLYTIMTTIAAFWFTLCRRSNCNCPVVNILKTCKEMIRLWKVSFLYAFVWLRIDQQFVFDQSLLSCYQSPVIHRPVSTDRKSIAVRNF